VGNAGRTGAGKEIPQSAPTEPLQGDSFGWSVFRRPAVGVESDVTTTAFGLGIKHGRDGGALSALVADPV
jgi:hypothetical protein